MTSIAWLQATLDWVSANPAWAGIIIFVVAALESLLIVGVIVPGALLMLGFGALIALGALDLWSTLLWAIAGAVVGDGVSFWIGYVYRDRLRNMWPFRHHPAILARGEVFFRRHGGKSIVFGRFVGPVRAIIPTVAGIMGMPPQRFTLVNIVSAIAWAPAYILPGFAVGASLKLASQVATRLGILLLLALVSIWLGFWLVRRIYKSLAPHANAAIEHALRWGVKHRYLGRLTTALLDPSRPEALALSGSALILIICLWLFLTVLVQTLNGVGFFEMDRPLYLMLQNLRTPAADHAMVFVSQFSGTKTILPLMLVILGWLAIKRHWLAASHWLIAIAAATGFTALLKMTLHVPRPADIYVGAAHYAFPSAHASEAAVAYGFLAILIAGEMSTKWRWLPYSIVGAAISIIAFSRLYLGAHWLSDVIGGLTLGLAWAAVLGIAFRRRNRHRLSPTILASLAAISIVASVSWQTQSDFATEVARYRATSPTLRSEPLATWHQETWQNLPPRRTDLEGEINEPLTIQYAGSLQTLTALLGESGWKHPPAVDLANMLHWLKPTPSVSELPVLPRTHEGHHEALLLVKSDDKNQHQPTLRLWSAGVALEPNALPLWIGTVSDQALTTLPFVTYLADLNASKAPLVLLENDLKTANASASWRTRQGAVTGEGEVLLVVQPQTFIEDPPP